MQTQSSEIIAVIVAGIFLALLLVGFIITMLVVYRKKQYQHQQELLHARLEIQENIFKNLSEEIHDNIGQELSVLKLTLSVISVRKEPEAEKFIAESKGMVNHIISSISDLSKSLHTDRIIKIGIIEAVKFELEKIEKTNLFKTHFTCADVAFQVNPGNEIFLFRIIQEILNNIIKHSSAQNIYADLIYKESSIIFTFTDDGIGFDVKEAMQRLAANKGIGLTSMVNRAKLIGGQISVVSQPGKGTKTVIEIPAVIAAASQPA
ncbi:MAG: ATP-binding protein [Chitinophagaceae bacterium]